MRTFLTQIKILALNFPGKINGIKRIAVQCWKFAAKKSPVPGGTGLLSGGPSQT